MKKGLMFTFVLALLAIMVFTLSVLIYKVSLEDEAMVSSIAIIDRNHDIYTSIEKGLKEIFDYDSAIELNVSLEDLCISIGENIPNNQSTEFAESVNDFEEYVEENFPEVALDTTGITETLSLTVKPQNVTYTHTDGFGFQRTQVIPLSASLITSYEVNISTLYENVTEIDWRDSTSGSVPFRVIASSENGTFLELSDTIDITRTVDIHVYLTSGKEVKIKVIPNEEGKLEVENKEDNEVYVVTTFCVTESPDEAIRVAYPESAILVNYSDFGTSRLGTVRIM